MIAERLFNRVRAARWWVKALDLASKAQYEQALEYLKLMEATDLSSRTGGVSRYEVYGRLLKALLLVDTNRYDEALDVLEAVVHQIDSITSMNDELKYLRCYASVLGHEAANHLVELRRNTGFESLFTINYRTVDLKRVPLHIKRKFPLRTHPNWQTDSGI
jgi:hypothetical protein